MSLPTVVRFEPLGPAAREMPLTSQMILSRFLHEQFLMPYIRASLNYQKHPQQSIKDRFLPSMLQRYKFRRQR